MEDYEELLLESSFEEINGTSHNDLLRQLLAEAKKLKAEESNDELTQIEIDRKLLGPFVDFNLSNGEKHPPGLGEWFDLNSFSEDEINHAAVRFKRAKNLHVKTKIGSIIFFVRNTPYSKHNDFKTELAQDYFNLAKDYKVLFDKGEKHIPEILRLFFHSLAASFYIATIIRNDQLIDDLIKYVVDFNIDNNFDHDSSLRTVLDTDHLIISFLKYFKEKSDLEAIVKRHIDLIDNLDTDNEHRRITGYTSIQNLDERLGLNLDEYDRKKAKCYEILATEAEGGPRNLAAISFIENAMRLYKKIKDETEYLRLQQKYQEVRGTAQFGLIEEALDQDRVDKLSAEIKERISKQDGKTILQLLALSPMFQPLHVIRKTADDQFKKVSLRSLFSSYINDKFGNTIAKYVTEEERKEHNFWTTYNFDFQIASKWLKFYFIESVKQKKVDYNVTIDFFRTTWLNQPLHRVYSGSPVEVIPLDVVEPTLKQLFKEIEEVYKDEEYVFNSVILLDSLTLKVETLLRMFCEKLSIPTFKPKSDDIVMEKNIDDLLSSIKHTDENPTGFDENDRIFIKYCMSEKAGENLRNKIAHGLMDRNEYSILYVVVVFSILLRLSKYDFVVENKL